ncbi:MAG: transposase [Candidatus Brocadiaceae baterium WH-1]|nr:MAG: transposase [Candidatus Jettenia sp. AMX2]
MIRGEVYKTSLVLGLVDSCYRSYPKGFVANVQKGEVPGRYESLARYLAKYVVSPPISLKRIDEYDGERVRYHYRSHKTERVEQEEVDVYTFIGRMIQHILPKGFKRIRYYGVQATRTFEKVKGVIQKALSKVSRVVKGAIKIIEEKRYRGRYKDGTGKDPFICEHCGQEMEVCTIWHPRYGVIYDELDEIRRGKYEQKAKEAIGEGGNRRAVRSSTEGVQISLFSMWN